MTDDQFFATFPDRHARIRKPVLELVKSKQRAIRYVDECAQEFQRLGVHYAERRRIILWRVPPGNPWYDPQRPPILKVPFLVFADETIEDRDDVLLPILEQIMQDARR